ncbi:uncharacterized protein ACOB8E_012581 [Sarcophilus harrisii]
MERGRGRTAAHGEKPVFFVLGGAAGPTERGTPNVDLNMWSTPQHLVPDLNSLSRDCEVSSPHQHQWLCPGHPAWAPHLGTQSFGDVVTSTWKHEATATSSCFWAERSLRLHGNQVKPVLSTSPGTFPGPFLPSGTP